MSAARLIAGVELGGTKCVCILAGETGEVRDRRRIATTTPDETLAAIERVLDGWRGFAALGIASFGPLSIDRAAADYGFITATTKPGWSRTDVARRLAARSAVPTGFDTDVVGAALGERRWGAATGLDDLAYITVGTGIGVGLIAGGRPVAGMTHGELGHVRVARLPGDDWPGVCPFHGDCVEGLASGTAIRARAGIAASDLPPDHPVWDGVVDALAQLLQLLVLTGVPRRIVMGGGVMVGRPHLFPRIRAALLPGLGGYVAAPAPATIDRYVVPPALGDLAGPLGAVVLGLEALATAK